MKCYSVRFNVGKSKYVVSYNDDEKKHSDGSPFFDVAIFKNKVKFNSFISELKKADYILL